MAELTILFPNLRAGHFEITSPKDVFYNCIAWAANDTEYCWWPAPGYFWPDGLPRVNSLDAIITAFELLGYIECNSAELEAGIEKIALYVDNRGRPQHASRQKPNGKWTSKCGNLEDIEHDLDGVSGTSYGQIARIMSRPR